MKLLKSDSNQYWAYCSVRNDVGFGVQILASERKVLFAVEGDEAVRCLQCSCTRFPSDTASRPQGRSVNKTSNVRISGSATVKTGLGFCWLSNMPCVCLKSRNRNLWKFPAIEAIILQTVKVKCFPILAYFRCRFAFEDHVPRSGCNLLTQREIQEYNWTVFCLVVIQWREQLWREISR